MNLNISTDNVEAGLHSKTTQDHERLTEMLGQEAIGKTVLVPVKPEDGDAPIKPDSGRNIKPIKPDIFLQYSNDNIRMWHLLGLHPDTEGLQDNTEWQQLTGYSGLRRLRTGANISNDQGTTRKTRLSMELHPDTIMSQLLGIGIE